MNFFQYPFHKQIVKVVRAVQSLLSSSEFWERYFSAKRQIYPFDNPRLKIMIHEVSLCRMNQFTTCHLSTFSYQRTFFSLKFFVYFLAA